MKKFLVVPSSLWQCELIKFLQKKNSFVYSLDDNNLAAGHKIADKRINIKISDTNKLKKFIKRNKIIPISTCSDFGQKVVNKLLNKKNNLFNKYLQRLKQQKLQIKTPFFKKNRISRREFIKFKKIVAKPLYGSGSKNVFLLNKNLKNKLMKNYLYEQFIQGKEYNVDGFFYNKKFYLYAIMEKKKVPNSLTVSYVMKSSYLAKSIQNNIKSMLQKFFIGMGYPNGPIHAEVIITNSKEVYMVESHPREAGFDLFYKLCKKISGKNLLLNKINSVQNITIKENHLNSNKNYSHYFQRMLYINKEGYIKDIYFKKYKKFSKIKIFTKIFKKKGDYIKFNSDDASRVGYVMLLSKQHKNLMRIAEKFIKKNFVLKLSKR